jgi:hypothetical protein
MLSIACVSAFYPPVWKAKGLTAQALTSATNVKWAQEDSGLEIDKGRRYVVQVWTERGRLLVHESGICRVVPPATIHAINERLEGSHRLRRGKGAVDEIRSNRNQQQQ